MSMLLARSTFDNLELKSELSICLISLKSAAFFGERSVQNMCNDKN